MSNVHAVAHSSAAHVPQVAHKPIVINKPPAAAAGSSTPNNPQASNGTPNFTAPQDLFIPSQPQSSQNNSVPQGSSGSQGSGGLQGGGGAAPASSGGGAVPASSGGGTPASGGSSGTGSSNSLMQLLMMLLAMLTQSGAGKNSPLGNNPSQLGQGQTTAQSPLGVNGVIA